MKLSDETIAARISQRKHYEPYRHKIHRLRLLVAGDVSALNGAGAANSSDMEALYRGETLSLADTLVTDIEAGRSNKLLQTVRTFYHQTTLNDPDFEAEDLTADEAVIMSAYLKSRLRRADPMREETGMVLKDYLCGGVGALFCGMRAEYPCIYRVDTLDLIWDLTASSFGTIGWASWIMRKPAYEWAEMFPKNQELKAWDAKGEGDKPVSVAVYYDRVGDGNLAYYLCDAVDPEGVVPEQLIERVKNPYSEDWGGEMVPCVPLVFMTYFSLPSVKIPISPVEMMLPAQIGLWESDRRIRDIVDSNRPVYQVEENSIDAKDLEAWKDSGGFDENGQALILRKKAGTEGLTIAPAIGVDQTLVAYRDANERELTGAGGANPYSSGNPLKDPKFASQVQAVQAASGLTAAAIGKDVAAFWRTVGKRMLAVGAAYDDQPLIVRTMDGATQIEARFDEMNPVRKFLRPDADLVVNEDAISFKPKDQQIVEAAQDIQIAASLQAQYPQLLPKMIETWLRKKGIRDIAGYLEQPQMPPQMPMGQPGMEDPAAMAMQNTGA